MTDPFTAELVETVQSLIAGVTVHGPVPSLFVLPSLYCLQVRSLYCLQVSSVRVCVSFASGSSCFPGFAVKVSETHVAYLREHGGSGH